MGIPGLEGIGGNVDLWGMKVLGSAYIFVKLAIVLAIFVPVIWLAVRRIMNQYKVNILDLRNRGVVEKSSRGRFVKTKEGKYKFRMLMGNVSFDSITRKNIMPSVSKLTKGCIYLLQYGQKSFRVLLPEEVIDMQKSKLLSPDERGTNRAIDLYSELEEKSKMPKGLFQQLAPTLGVLGCIAILVFGLIYMLGDIKEIHQSTLEMQEDTRVYSKEFQDKQIKFMEIVTSGDLSSWDKDVPKPPEHTEDIG